MEVNSIHKMSIFSETRNVWLAYNTCTTKGIKNDQ